VLSKSLLSPLLGLAAVFFVGAPLARPQAASPVAPVKSEIQLEGGLSFGNIHLFGFSDNRRILPVGFEYDRNSFGGLIGARVAYVAEILPLVLVNEPARYALNGRALTSERQWQYGAGLSPAGVRMMWRPAGTLQPYLIGKGGVLYFKNRVLSPEGTHLQFSAEFGGGVEKAITNRIGFRLGYTDFHFSNANIGRHNPGIDFMEINAGLAIRLAPGHRY
jgi:hypothetical protein